MLNLIEKLRQKSERTRRRYAFGVSGAVVAVLFFFWFSSFQTRNNPELKVADSTPSPANSVIETFNNGLATVKDLVMKSKVFSGQSATVSNMVSSSTPVIEDVPDPYSTVIITDPK